ncbi:helix-turn-helix domain-containing protein [Natronolimnobius sp. AArcel1]|uniref:helix-turn-helix domain-containing protein n=1 Tax=Natronolimnobius sp. AArcel1 TaxID=1679093 RepID=UPI0013EDFAF4|nr:helix-turn-helix domain-containing protein [Natronolimnobius sp. AArcel1]NGM69274.1 helix-turn-helix domain-containing protein [Natronolimnobius sp. AArcel1]
MTTVVELEVPAERLGLARTFDRVPTFECEIGGLIGDTAPLVHVSGEDRHDVKRALEADPSVDVVASLSGNTQSTGADHNRWLFRLEFGEDIKLFQEIVSSNDGAMLSARSHDNTWSLRLLFHDRESVSTSHALFEQYDYHVNVTRITETDSADLDLDRLETPLTETQYETITMAHELGYFDVPRQVTLEELASEMDISHQALSERLRRSHAALISSELADRHAPKKADP